MPKFTDLMAQAATGHVTITEDWMQGRTTYGGLSAALSYSVARKHKPEGMTLRSAQIGFVGPAGGPVETRAEIVRQGKSSCFVSADVLTDKGVVTRSLFVFGSSRDVDLEINTIPAPPKVPAPDEIESFARSDRMPGFLQNFDMLWAAGAIPLSGADEADMTLWMRHKDKDARGMLALLAIGDAPPPAAITTFKERKIFSSMNWSIEVLTDDPATDDGWFLARHTSPQGSSGYCVQDMTMWNAAGAPMMIGRQTVAIFNYVSPSAPK